VITVGLILLKLARSFQRWDDSVALCTISYRTLPRVIYIYYMERMAQYNYSGQQVLSKVTVSYVRIEDESFPLTC
jgi:hypothetical protein